MKSVNLIPAPRRVAKRRRRHRNACVAACAAYAVLLGCALGGAHVLWGGQGAALDEQLSSVDASIRQFERQSTDARTELAAARATVEANRTVAEQPDWSVLLAVLGKTTGEDVVLRGVTVTPVAPPVAPGARPTGAAPAASTAAHDVVLEISGVGRSQLAVQRHVLRVEETGLFSRVALVDTGRETFLDGDAIGFKLQCNFGEPRRLVQQHTDVPAVPAVSATDPGGITQ